MGTKTTGTVPAKRNQPVKKYKKTASISKAKKATRGGTGVSLGSKVDVGDAIRSMTATLEKNSADFSAAILAIDERLSEKLATSRMETDKKIAETDAKLVASKMETDAKLVASDERLSEKLATAIAELSSSQQETNRVFRESMDRLSHDVGGVNNRFGEIIEMVVLPGLLGEMDKQCGLKFDNVSPRKRFTDSGKEYAEIDLFLENGESVMAVEAKARFTLGMANQFVRQVESLREHEVKAGVVGKTIYAAIAAIGIDDNVRKFASENGLYLVEVNNSNSKVTIRPPKEVVGKW